MKKIGFVLAVVALVAGLATSCDSLTGDTGGTGLNPGTNAAPNVTAAPPTAGAIANMTAVAGSEASFGQALDFGGLVIRVDAPFEDSGATPTPGNRPWAALVTLQNNRSADAMYGPLDFHFIDAGGTVYEAIGASNLQMMGNALLAPGQQAQAYIVMQLPSSSAPAQIRYEPYIPSDEKWFGLWR
jgi:hypothetical protein